MNKEEIDILYSFANDEDCRYVYDWQGFNYEEICPLIDKLIKENKKYKEEITNLSKEIDMWNAKYNDMFDENRELKEILANHGIISTCENCETFGVCPHSYREYDYKYECDELKKQLENYKKLGFKHLQDKNNNLEAQQKEFKKWLEDYINLFDKKDIYEEGSCDMLEEILQKYRSIIGDDR